MDSSDLVESSSSQSGFLPPQSSLRILFSLGGKDPKKVPVSSL